MAAATRNIQSKICSVLDFCIQSCPRRFLHSNSSSWSVIRHQLTSRSCFSCPAIQNMNNNYLCKRNLASRAKPRMTFSGDLKFSQQPIVYINATYNNTMLTLTDFKGNTLAWTSAGAEGYKNSKRGSSVAAQQASISLAKKASDFGIQKVRIKVKGIGNGRQASVKSLVASGLQITSITDVTPIPHNGCRPKKARRI